MTSEEKIRVGARIHDLRESRGLSIAELARKSGVAKSYVSQLESGEADNPSLEAVRKIAAGLGVRVSDLIGEEESGEPRAGKLPPGLEAFRRSAGRRGMPLAPEDVDMLLGLQYRGRRPETEEDFAFLYHAIKRTLQ